jgi:methylmalonyl-CoA/ethylmalonyl-CoA epimerase
LSTESFRRVTQIGIIVKDIEEARTVWAELLGLEEPPIVETESWESTRMTFRGKPSEGRAKLAFFHLENIAIELIQPVGGPSTWQDFLERFGDGIHHIAFNVENLEETLEKAESMGMGIEQRGEYEGGCYIYADSKSKLGGVVEILHNYGR